MDGKTEYISSTSLRVAGVGAGTFIVIAGFLIYIALCFVGSFLKRPGMLYSIITFIYGTLLLYLATAKRKSENVRFANNSWFASDPSKILSFSVIRRYKLKWTHSGLLDSVSGYV